MSTMNPSMMLLRLRLRLQSLGLGNLACFVLLLLTILFWLLWLPHLRLQRDVAKDALKRIDLALKKPLPVVPKVAEARQTNLDRFYKTLGEKEYVEEQLKTLFALAKKQGLSLASGEYKSAIERNGNYRKYQITLPLKGNYNQIRQFGEQALQSIPFASLDEMSFKRDNISNRVLEARLRLTLYLLDDDDKHPETEAKP